MRLALTEADMAANTHRQVEFPIIDSHIHLYTASQLQNLAWAPSLPEGHVLKRQNSVAEYRSASRSQPSLVGFVFVETDRKSLLSEDGWQHPLEEISFLRRIKSGRPTEGEGHDPKDKEQLLGVVAWAPTAAERHSLQSYLEQSQTAQDLRATNGLVRGFRYLVQDKPKGHMLESEMWNGLLLLEQAGAKTFDLGVDFRQGGHWQLTEAVQMLQRFYAQSTGSLKIVINHLCKPNLRPDATQDDKAKWEHDVKALADLPTTYMKLSGLFSELQTQESGEPLPISDLLESTRFETSVIFDNFGPENIMFGSDWPVCNVGGPGPEKSWSHWVNFVAAILQDRGLSDAEKARVWAGTAKEVYELDVDL